LAKLLPLRAANALRGEILMDLTRHPAIQRAAIGIAIGATSVAAWRVFDTPIQRQMERQVGPDVLVHIGMVVTAFIAIAMASPMPRAAPVTSPTSLGSRPMVFALFLCLWSPTDRRR
jgi:hypothetical protein